MPDEQSREISDEEVVTGRTHKLREALGFLVNNVVMHPLAGLFWFAADLGAGEWASRSANWLHDR